MMKEFKKFVFAIIAILCTASIVLAHWDPCDGHKMHFPQMPNPIGWDIDLRNYELADDWQCSQTGEVNDIHFWISWATDYVGTINQFTVRIYDNDPNPPFSKPYKLLWQRTFTQGQFVIDPNPGYGDQGYWIPNPTNPTIHRPDHQKYFQVNIKDINAPLFTQQQGQIYWLTLKVPIDQYPYPGWKTSLDHFMDAAVVKYGPSGWTPLYEPNSTIPIDFAFVITGPTPEPNVKWRQRPDLSSNGLDVKALDPCTLADDFECNKSTLITDITIWGSWKYDVLPPNGANDVWFTLSIHSDIPASQSWTGYSMPNEVLWLRDLQASEVSIEREDINEGWWDPYSYQGYLPIGDHVCWKYVFHIPEANAFCQKGEPNKPITYWLDVQAHPNGNAEFGWKSSIDHWNDDAVYAYADEPHMGFWGELRYPSGHPLEPNSIDLAFVIDGNIPCANEPEPEVKWRQGPDLSTNGLDVSASDACLILADDFECNKSTLITDITIWGSWKYDVLPPNGANDVSFTLSIHSDIPDADPCGPYYHSMPGNVLWLRNVMPSEVSIEQQGIYEGWYDPYYWEYLPIGDQVCWKYVFHIPESEAFCQQGEPNKPIIYWLDVQAHPNDVNGYAKFGWKSSIDHWNDDAVYSYGSEPNIGWWGELIYPSGHPYYPNSIDLAFVIDGNIPCTQPEDFGDAPDGAAAPLYPTLLINNGARHIIDGVTFMGALVDAEGDGQPTANADGDDLNPPAFDDEDGVIFPVPLIPGQPASVTVTASVAGALDAWIDFNADGSWAQAGDQIAAALPLAAGANAVGFVVPAAATPGQTYARFRFSTAGGLQPFGPASNGEVEDYNVYIEQPLPEHELGDAPDSSNSFGVGMTAYPIGVAANYPTVYVAGSPPFGPIHLQPKAVAWLGPNVSLENEADIGPDQDGINNINPPANTPNLDGADDGVLNMPLVLPHCCPNTTFQYQVNVVNPNVNLYVNVWFDWNRDGDWNDSNSCFQANPNFAAPEWAVQNQVLPAGSMPVGINQKTTPSFRPYHPNSVDANIWMRITLSEQPWVGSGSGGSGPANGYEYGETEDYYFSPVIECMKPTALEYPAWVNWNRPCCWCYKRQCRGDADGIKSGLYWVAGPDLTLLQSAFNKGDAALRLVPNGICADFDHTKSGLYRVAGPDLTILQTYFNRGQAAVPCCDIPPTDCVLAAGDKWNFWTN